MTGSWDKNQVICVVGLGLIGGSFALDCRKHNLFTRIIGVDVNEAHQKQAVKLGLVDEVNSLEEALHKADVIVLAIPIHAILEILPTVLEHIKSEAVVFDMGSTKASILDIAQSYKNGNRFVAAHPMAGTEHSGPSAAVHDLYKGKVFIVCDAHKSSAEAIDKVDTLLTFLGMRRIDMSAEEHDIHVAYISHISHITSFALATTVLEKEKSEKAIFELASGGFESTVRLAKSPPSMWLPIFLDNKDNILEVLDTYIEHISKFRSLIATEDKEGLQQIMEEGNLIKKILK